MCSSPKKVGKKYHTNKVTLERKSIEMGSEMLSGQIFRGAQFFSPVVSRVVQVNGTKKKMFFILWAIRNFFTIYVMSNSIHTFTVYNITHRCLTMTYVFAIANLYTTKNTKNYKIIFVLPLKYYVQFCYVM
jgi:hypothetical protein